MTIASEEPPKTRLERLKKNPRLWVLVCFFLILILSYGEILKENGIPHLLQCSPSEQSHTNGEIISHESASEECGLRMRSVSNNNEKQQIIQDFKSKKQECAMLIVNSTSAPDKWMIVGFNDTGKFKSVLIDNPINELAVELTKEPVNKRKVVELVTSSLGRTIVDKSIWCSSLVSHISSNLLEALYHAISFAFLVFVFGIFYMDEVTKTVKNGFEDIGTTVAGTAQPITASAVDTLKSAVNAIEKLASAAEEVKKSAENMGKPNVSLPDETKVPPEIEKLIEEAENEALICIEKDDFNGAEKKWIDVMEQHPSNIEIVENIFSFYDKYDKEFTKERALKIILSFESSFKNNPRFYRILANIYMGLRKVGDDGETKNNAIRAANKSIELERDNPRWETLLGYVYYWFDEDIQKAIHHTDKALKMEESVKHPMNFEEHLNFIIDCKNNLSYFYALTKTCPKMATDYAKAVLSFYESEEGVKKAMSLDSMGYVLLRFSKKKEATEKALFYFDKAARILPEEKSIQQHISETYTELAKYT